MQAAFKLTTTELTDLLQWIDSNGKPIIYLKDTAFGEKMLTFQSVDEIVAFATTEEGSIRPSFGLALHYPEAKGFVDVHRVKLNPKHCDGHTFRYEIRGWGIVLLQFSNPNADVDSVECVVSCNTKKRAEAWAGTYPELKDPALWDWKVVDSICRKLRKFVRQYE